MPDRPNTWEIRLWGRKVTVELLNSMLMQLHIPASLHQELAQTQKRLSFITQGQPAAFFSSEGETDENGRIISEARWIWKLQPGMTLSLVSTGQGQWANWTVQDDGTIALTWSKHDL